VVIAAVSNGNGLCCIRSTIVARIRFGFSPEDTYLLRQFGEYGKVAVTTDGTRSYRTQLDHGRIYIRPLGRAGRRTCREVAPLGSKTPRPDHTEALSLFAYLLFNAIERPPGRQVF
jgi:hypothetical protein